MRLLGRRQTGDDITRGHCSLSELFAREITREAMDVDGGARSAEDIEACPWLLT